MNITVFVARGLQRLLARSQLLLQGFLLGFRGGERFLGLLETFFGIDLGLFAPAALVLEVRGSERLTASAAVLRALQFVQHLAEFRRLLEQRALRAKLRVRG